MIKTLQVYTIDELNKDARTKAIDDNRLWNVDYMDWWQYVYEWYQDEKLPAAGFVVHTKKERTAKGHEYERPKMQFSGFASQGDGACFEADVDVLHWLRVNRLCNAYRSLAYWLRQEDTTAIVTIGQGGHYVHANTMYLDSVELDVWADDDNLSYERASDQLEEVAKIILEDAKDKANDLYRSLETEYEWLTGDEVVEDSLLANDVMFWSNGRKANAPW